MNILTFTRLESTNAFALQMGADAATDGTIILAHEQTAGQGQYGRTFVSPVGGLYFSLILQPNVLLEQLSQLTLAVGLACCHVLEQHCPLQPLLKWPNDIYVGGKKLAGVLCQTFPFSSGETPKVVVGVGINVNSNVADFPDELHNQVITLRDLTGEQYENGELLEALVPEIRRTVNRLEYGLQKLLAEWRLRDYLKGQSIVWQNGESKIVGVGHGLLHDGRYSLCDPLGTIHDILAGSITLVRS